MIKLILHLLTRAVAKTFAEPKRSKQFDAQSEPFIHRTPSGLIFELWPTEYVDRFIAVEGIYERQFLNYLQSVIPSEAVMLDIGANIGNHAIFLAAKFREIHCFEPNPQVAARLRRNIGYNNLTDRISVHEFGLGDSDEILTFAENCDGNLGGSKFLKQGDELGAYQRSMQLEVRCAASAVNALNLSRIDFIKIDVEGMEEAVLAALKPIIAQYRPVVAFEHHEQDVAAGTFSRIQSFFENYRFTEPCFTPDGSTKDKLIWNLKYKGQPRLTEVSEPEHRTYENIIAFPN